MHLYVLASREDLQLGAESAASLLKQRASVPARHWNPGMFCLTGENSFLSACHITVLLPISPCKQEAALLNIISIESKWCLCLISSGLGLYQRARCWSCICSLECFRALESDRFMFITLNHSIIDSTKGYFLRWEEAVGGKKTTKHQHHWWQRGQILQPSLRALEGLILLLFRAWSCLCCRKGQSCGRKSRLIHSDDADEEKPPWNQWDQTETRSWGRKGQPRQVLLCCAHQGTLCPHKTQGRALPPFQELHFISTRVLCVSK